MDSNLKLILLSIFAGIHPKKIRLLADQNPGVSLSSSTLFTQEIQTLLRNIFHKYYAGLCKQLETENQRLRDLEKAHRRLLDSRGDVPQEKLDKYEGHVTGFNKLKTSLLTLTDYLDKDLPELTPKEEVEDTKSTIELLTVEFGENITDQSINQSSEQSIDQSIMVCIMLN